MKRFILFGLVIPIFIFGCGNGSSQVFIPEIRSGYEATQSVFVPAVQSEGTADSQVVPGTAVQAAETSTITTPAKETQDTADADVLFVKALLVKENTWTFSVTVAHPDTGWEDYADGWDVILPDGSVLYPDSDSPFTRLLLHPHENEQPFTRSQGGIEIPVQVENVTVRAHDIVDGFGGKEITVDLTADSGPGFEVQHQ